MKKLVYIVVSFLFLVPMSADVTYAGGCTVNPTIPPTQWLCSSVTPQPRLACGWIDPEGEPRSSQVHAVDLNGGTFEVGDEFLLILQADRLPTQSYGQQIFQRTCLPSEYTLVSVERLPCKGQVLQQDTRVLDISDSDTILTYMAYGLTPCEDPMVTVVRLRLDGGTPGQRITTHHQVIRLDDPNYQALLSRKLTLTVGGQI